MWRPDGWNTIKVATGDLAVTGYDKNWSAAFECGADAMLKALRKKGQHVKHSADSLERESWARLQVDGEGTLVFLPDESDKRK